MVEQIKCIGLDPAVITETVRQVREQTEEGIERLNHERTALQQLETGDAKVSSWNDAKARLSKLGQ